MSNIYNCYNKGPLKDVNLKQAPFKDTLDKHKQLEQLRSMRYKSVEARDYKKAFEYGIDAYHLSNESDEDAIQLSKILLFKGEYQHSLTYLNANLIEKDIESRILAAKCYLKLKNCNKVLELTDDLDSNIDKPQINENPFLFAQLAIQRGLAFYFNECRIEARQLFILAFKMDYNVSLSLDYLTKLNLISYDGLKRLIDDMQPLEVDGTTNLNQIKTLYNIKYLKKVIKIDLNWIQDEDKKIYVNAKKHFLYGDYNRSYELFKSICKNNVKEEDSLHYLILLLLFFRNTEDIILFKQLFIQHHLSNQYLLLISAIYELSEDNKDEANEYFEKCYNYYPNYYTNLIIYAEFLIDYNNTNLIPNTLLSAIMIKSQDYLPYILLARYHRWKGTLKEATKFMKHASKRIDDKIQNQNPFYLLELGALAICNQNFSSSIQALNTALKLFKSYEKQAHFNKYIEETYYQIAQYYRKTEELEKSIEYYNIILNTNSQNGLAIIGKVKAYQSLQQYNLAKRLILDASLIIPDQKKELDEIYRQLSFEEFQFKLPNYNHFKLPAPSECYTINQKRLLDTLPNFVNEFEIKVNKKIKNLNMDKPIDIYEFDESSEEKEMILKGLLSD